MFYQLLFLILIPITIIAVYYYYQNDFIFYLLNKKSIKIIQEIIDLQPEGFIESFEINFKNYKNEYMFFMNKYKKIYVQSISLSRAIIQRIPGSELYYFHKYFGKDNLNLTLIENTINDFEELYNKKQELVKLSDSFLKIINEYTNNPDKKISYRQKETIKKYVNKKFDDNRPYPAMYFEFYYISEKGRSFLNHKILINKHFLNEYLKYFYEDQRQKQQKTLSQTQSQSKPTKIVYDNANTKLRTPWKTKIYTSDEQERSELTNSLRAKIFERDNFTCCYCGASISNGQTTELHCDHIFPISKGGKTTPNNLQTLCKSCNLNKSNKWRDIDIKAYVKRNGQLPYEEFEIKNKS